MSTTTPIADHWDQIQQLGGVVLPDDELMLLRGMFLAGAMAALHELTGWDPETDGVQVIAVNHRNLTLIVRELSAAYQLPTSELYEAVQ